MPKWNQVCNSDKCKYESCTLKLSRDIVIPFEALLCRDAIMTVFINKKCRLSSMPLMNVYLVSEILQKIVPVPGRNYYVKEQHNIARNAFKW